jgi:hypothetical protein
MNKSGRPAIAQCGGPIVDVEMLVPRQAAPISGSAATQHGLCRPLVIKQNAARVLKRRGGDRVQEPG